MSLKVGLLDVAVVVDAGIVVDLVDCAEVGDDSVGVSQNRLAFGDVEPVGLHVRAECFGPAHGFGQSFGVDVGERESCASRGEVERQCSADPEPAPVMTATLPSNCCAFIFSSCSVPAVFAGPCRHRMVEEALAGIEIFRHTFVISRHWR